MQDAGCFHWIGLPSFFNSSVMMMIQQLCTAPIPAARLNCWTALVELSAGSCWKCPDHRTCHREAGGYCILILRSAVKCTQLFWALERRIHPIGLTGSCLVDTSTTWTGKRRELRDYGCRACFIWRLNDVSTVASAEPAWLCSLGYLVSNFWFKISSFWEQQTHVHVSKMYMWRMEAVFNFAFG